MTVGTFVQPDFQRQTGTAYKTNIDNAIAAAAVAGRWFAPHETSPPGMAVVVDKGRVYNPTIAASFFGPAPTTVALAAPASHPRVDRIVIDPADGALEHIQGVEAAAPSAPAIPRDRLPCARIENLTPATDRITNRDIVDERAPNGLGLGNAARQDHSQVVARAAYAVSLADHGRMIRCDTAGGPFTVTLPDPAAVFDGFVVAIKRRNAGGANALTIVSAGAAAIDGAARLVLESELDAAVLSAGPRHWQVRAGYRLRDGQVATAKLAEAAVTPGKIADDAVGLAKLAHAARGSLLYWGPGGAPATLAPGTPGRVLTTRGASASPTWAPTPFAGQLLHVVDEKPPGTNGGSFVSGSWVTRDLNTIKTNEISGASLALNQLTLPVGKYFIIARAPARSVSKHKMRWRNITDGTDVVHGTTSVTQSNTAIETHGNVSGRFSVTGASKVFALQHRAEVTRNIDGLGSGANFGVSEVFAELFLWKVG